MRADDDPAGADEAAHQRLAPELPPARADHRATQGESNIAALHRTGAREFLIEKGEIAQQRHAREPADQRIMETIVGCGRAEDQIRIGFGTTLEIGVEKLILGGWPIVGVAALQHGRAPSITWLLPADTRR